MKYLKIVLVALVAMAMTSSAISVTVKAYAKSAQGQATALERGYRTGYSDGYSAGSRDVSDRAARDYQSKEEYQRGDRSYNEAWGTAEDYRDGYQQGFEVGYAAGYDRRAFNSSIPTGLTRRAKTVDIGPTMDNNTSPNDAQTNSGASVPSVGGPLTIPPNAILLVELQSSLSTDASQQGDRFQARVVDPREFEGAIIEGRVTRVKRAGKVKGTAELQLSFETIRMDNHSSGFRANIVEVVNMGNRDGAGTVDSEGGVKGKSSTKDSVSKIGASTGIGAAIGALLGGGKGAAIGAAIGGTVGTAGVLQSRGKELRLERGQQLRIRTATETRIQ
ncbi:MAG: hypothetical protein M3R52_05230 [Acidobacteriota bacterium]|nr:hypothetical protein [Acidobacteriota bacterium]